MNAETPVQCLYLKYRPYQFYGLLFILKVYFMYGTVPVC